MSDLEFADKRSKWTEYFICTLKAFGRRTHLECNCLRRIRGRFYLWLFPQNEFDCRCTAGRNAVFALGIVDNDFASFLEVTVVVGDVGLEAGYFCVSEVKVCLEFLILGIENDNCDFRLEGVTVGGDLYVCFGILGGIDSPRAGACESAVVSHDPKSLGGFQVVWTTLSLRPEGSVATAGFAAGINPPEMPSVHVRNR